jgi:hypothetical protein
MKIKNVTGTADKTCACDSWFEHWKTFSGQTITYCPVNGCLARDLVGAHVRLVGDWTTYIYPLCKAHNQSTEELDTSDAYKLVCSDPKQTCQRK